MDMAGVERGIPEIHSPATGTVKSNMTMKKTALIFLPVLAALAIAIMLVDHTSPSGETAETHTVQHPDGQSVHPSFTNKITATDISAATNTQHKLTPEQEEEQKEWGRLNRRLPYQGTLPADILGSIGQQVKYCDLVVVGTATDIKRPEKSNSKVPDVILTINVESNVFGKARSKKLKVELYSWRASRTAYSKGDRFLIFLSTVDHDVLRYLEFAKLDFDLTTKKGRAVSRPVVFYGTRAVIRLDGGDEEREILAAVDGYLNCLKRGPRDAEKYYYMLRDFTHSPVERVRDDARINLKHILSIPGIAEKAATDGKLYDGLRDYAQFALEVRKRRAAEAAEKEQAQQP